MKKSETVGSLSLKASRDSTRYDPLEIAHALTEDLAKELQICAHSHMGIFAENEYCVGYVIASDPLIAGVMRKKFFAMLHLPSPRPDQCIFLYNKMLDRFTKRLWTLPNAYAMAQLSEATYVAPKYREMKAWCDAFYGLRFWEFIRYQHKIDMLSESEYLNAHREELIQAGCQEVTTPVSDPFDFSKVSAYKVIDSDETSLKQ